AIRPKELSLGLFTLPTDRHSPVWEIVTNLVNNVNTFFVVVCLFALYDPPSMSSREGPINKWGRTCGMAVVFMLTAAETMCYMFGWVRHIVWFKWISGFGGGVGLAMLAGRLGSKYIGPPVWLIPLLYFYSVIQGAMGGFGASEDLERVMLFLALALKCLLLIFVAWVLESQKLLDYMFEVRKLTLRQESAKDQLDEASGGLH